MHIIETERFVSCHVKSFCPRKGFGFLSPDAGGNDILLHRNVLKESGLSAVTPGLGIDVMVEDIEGRARATQVIGCRMDNTSMLSTLAQKAGLTSEQLEEIDFQPARIKWFDSSKGFGFANTFGSADDIFVHLDVLLLSGMANLETGEAVALRIAQSKKGWTAVQIAEWL